MDWLTWYILLFLQSGHYPLFKPTGYHRQLSVNHKPINFHCFYVFMLLLYQIISFSLECNLNQLYFYTVWAILYLQLKDFGHFIKMSLALSRFGQYMQACVCVCACLTGNFGSIIKPIILTQMNRNSLTLFTKSFSRIVCNLDFSRSNAIFYFRVCFKTSIISNVKLTTSNLYLLR